MLQGFWNVSLTVHVDFVFTVSVPYDFYLDIAMTSYKNKIGFSHFVNICVLLCINIVLEPRHFSLLKQEEVCGLLGMN